MKLLNAVVSSLLFTTPVSCFVAKKTTGWRHTRSISESESLLRRQLSPADIPLPDLSSLLDQTLARLDGLKSISLPEVSLPDAGPFLQETLDRLGGLDQEVQMAWTTVLTQIQSILSQEPALQTEFSKYASEFNQFVDQWLLEQSPQAEAVYQQVLSQIQQIPWNTPEAIALSSVLTYVVVSSVLTWGAPPPPGRPYPLNRYDPVAARLYFDARPLQVVQRGLLVGLKSLSFALNLLMDKITNQWEQKEEQRGMELAQLLTDLGPTFIKVGQSLSIRTDLLSPGYVRGLQTLQDKVPPFDSVTAKQILEDEWGQPLMEVLTKISDEPVAAASLGQVYKATTKDGLEVAIKVQRPKIMNQIALDMHLLREFAPIVKRTFNANTDLVGTVDAWGLGFVDELDYIQEAQNAKYFMERIQETPLKEVVLAPDVVDELTTPSVLVTEWIDGERLDKSSNEDVTILCSICMNTYLTMLLELGLLHCDPHPGNLLRTPDGRLCILDWGMVTKLPEELQLALIEHMAHLTSSDYAEVPRDLLLLGFIPEEKADAIEDSGVVEVLADIYGAWTSGGGVAAIHVNQVVDQLQDLTAKKGNLFQIPPYFAYIAKSFSVLEGIGLSNDPKYSIVNECLPYVSNRLLTDKSSMGPALQTFIFGPDKSNIDTRIVDYKRVEQLVTGFGNFSTSASGALLGKDSLSRTQMLEEAADLVLDIVVTDEVTPVQDILLEQVAKIVSASSRSLWTQARERSGTLPSGRTVLGTIVDPLGLFESSPLVNTCDADAKTIETTRKIVGLVRNQLAAETGSHGSNAFKLQELQPDELIELSTILGRKVWERRTALLKTGSRFATKLLQVTAFRLENSQRVIRAGKQQRQQQQHSPQEQEQQEQEVVNNFGNNRQTTDSNRLTAARDRLNSLKEAPESENVAIKDAMPVRQQ